MLNFDYSLLLSMHIRFFPICITWSDSWISWQKWVKSCENDLQKYHRFLMLKCRHWFIFNLAYLEAKKRSENLKSSIASYGRILSNISFIFWAMIFKKNCFWDWLTFILFITYQQSILNSKHLSIICHFCLLRSKLKS